MKARFSFVLLAFSLSKNKTFKQKTIFIFLLSMLCWQSCFTSFSGWFVKSSSVKSWFHTFKRSSVPHKQFKIHLVKVLWKIVNYYRIWSTGLHQNIKKDTSTYKKMSDWYSVLSWIYPSMGYWGYLHNRRPSPKSQMHMCKNYVAREKPTVQHDKHFRNKFNNDHQQWKRGESIFNKWKELNSKKILLNINNLNSFFITKTQKEKVTSLIMTQEENVWLKKRNSKLNYREFLNKRYNFEII